MFIDYIRNTTCGILDQMPLQHENLENEKESFVLSKSERNKKNTHPESNNPNYDNDEGNVTQFEQKKHTGLSNKLRQARFLIAESEIELQSLFKAYLDLLGAESEIVDNGNRALTTFLQSKNNGKKYDAVVIDTHLKGKKGLDVAKKIRQSDNSQKIILVTTNMKKQFSKDELQSTAIDEKDILVMPFELSSLSKLLIQ